jgi:hypothetical protein
MNGSFCVSRRALDEILLQLHIGHLLQTIADYARWIVFYPFRIFHYLHRIERAIAQLDGGDD